MSDVRNSVETVNAAATAIVAAESRVQPTAVQKRRWSSCWSTYWCFGSYKQSKRIGHAVLVSEPAPIGAVVPVTENRNHSSTIVLPFIAPPSSPASFLQSGPTSATQSPAGLLFPASLSVQAQSPGGTAPIFTIGPYAHETQLVSPPVFSTFTTEPSTASFTPPPEQVQMTTPSSPEVPFAELLSSSLARNKKISGSTTYLSQYEFKPYQYPGSPGSYIKSPRSGISTSGTSSPFPDKHPVMEFHASEVPKFLGYEHFPNYKWDSRVGSGSLTPNGWGSRLGSGTLTPNSGISMLGSGTLTPNGGEPPSRDNNLLESQIPEVESSTISDKKPENVDTVVGHRVSFELFGEDIPTCTVSMPLPPASRNTLQAIGQDKDEQELTKANTDSFRAHFIEENVDKAPGLALDGEGAESHQKNRTISLGSSKDFNFNNTKGVVTEKSGIECEWWTNETVIEKESSPRNSWSFFPMLQSNAG